MEYRWPYDVPFFWEEAWKVIADMKGLRNLRVSLSETDSPSYTPDSKSLIHLFHPMVSVKVPLFKVEFYWPVDLEGVLQHFNDIPFQIEVRGDNLPPGRIQEPGQAASVCDTCSSL
jgi:hypothetical protein